MMMVFPPPVIPLRPPEQQREPYRAPRPITGELQGCYVTRLAKSFEDWVNSTF